MSTGSQKFSQTDKVTERQNDSMADSRAAKEPALVFIKMSESQTGAGNLKKNVAGCLERLCACGMPTAFFSDSG